MLVSPGRVLLGHRSPDRRWYPDVWDVIGGHIRRDESPEQALCRELREELGITVDEPLGDPLTRVVDPDGQDGGLDIRIWAIPRWHGQIENRDAHEHDELRWFGHDELDGLRFAHPRLPDVLEQLFADGLAL